MEKRLFVWVEATSAERTDFLFAACFHQRGRMFSEASRAELCMDCNQIHAIGHQSRAAGFYYHGTSARWDVGIVGPCPSIRRVVISNTSSGPLSANTIRGGRRVTIIGLVRPPFVARWWPVIGHGPPQTRVTLLFVL